MPYSAFDRISVCRPPKQSSNRALRAALLLHMTLLADPPQPQGIHSCFRAVAELTDNWWVCSTFANGGEKFIAERLIEERADFFLPLRKERREHANAGRPGKTKRTVETPLYPRYVFLNGDYARDVALTCSRRFSSAQCTVWPVASKVQPILTEQLVNLAASLEVNHYLGAPVPFRKGDKVRVCRGMFEGIIGVFDRADEMKNVYLNNALFNSSVPLEQIPVEYLELV